MADGHALRVEGAAHRRDSSPGSGRPATLHEADERVHAFSQYYPWHPPKRWGNSLRYRGFQSAAGVHEGASLCAPTAPLSIRWRRLGVTSLRIAEHHLFVAAAGRRPSGRRSPRARCRKSISTGPLSPAPSGSLRPLPRASTRRAGMPYASASMTKSGWRSGVAEWLRWWKSPATGAPCRDSRC